jgi:hypothetical protein
MGKYAEETNLLTRKLFLIVFYSKTKGPNWLLTYWQNYSNFAKFSSLAFFFNIGSRIYRQSAQPSFSRILRGGPASFSR